MSCLAVPWSYWRRSWITKRSMEFLHKYSPLNKGQRCHCPMIFVRLREPVHILSGVPTGGARMVHTRLLPVPTRTGTEVCFSPRARQIMGMSINTWANSLPYLDTGLHWHERNGFDRYHAVAMGGHPRLEPGILQKERPVAITDLSGFAMSAGASVVLDDDVGEAGAEVLGLE